MLDETNTWGWSPAPAWSESSLAAVCPHLHVLAITHLLG